MLTLEWKKFLQGLRGALFGEAPFNWSGKFAFVTYNADGAMTRLLDTVTKLGSGVKTFVIVGVAMIKSL